MKGEREEKEKESPVPKQLMGMERRKHIRLSLMGVAGVTVRDGVSQEVYMGCIGRGGAGFYTHDEFRTGQLLVLDLKLKEERWRDMDMKFAARVRWVQPVGKLFMVGLKFEKMSDERYHHLLRYLRLMKGLQL